MVLLNFLVFISNSCISCIVDALVFLRDVCCFFFFFCLLTPTHCLSESAFALAITGKSFEDLTSSLPFICLSFFLFLVHRVFFLPLSLVTPDIGCAL